METRFIIQILLVIFLPIGSLAQGITKLVSFDDISSNNLIIKGTYDEIITKYGRPEAEYDWTYRNPINHLEIRLAYVNFDGFGYIRYKDSVQLHFVDFRQTKRSIYLMGIPLQKGTKIKALLRSLYSKHIIDRTFLQDDEFGTIEGHYCSYKKVKILYLPNVGGIRDNVGICFRNALIDHAIWYIEIPVVIPGSIAVNQ